MCLKIDLGNYPNLWSVLQMLEEETEPFSAIEPGTSKEESKPSLPTFDQGRSSFAFIADPMAAESHKYGRELRSSTMVEPGSTKCCNLGRRASDPSVHSRKVSLPRVRNRSAPSCPAIDRAKILGDHRLTEAAKKLNDEELALLYVDILKPLDFNEMLHERRKEL